jgi:hypothetical protein
VCNSGCIVSGSISEAKNANVITFTSAFGDSIVADTLIDISVTGFVNPSTETVYSVYFEVFYNVVNLIDKFENLGTLSGSQSIYSKSFSNTYILITSPRYRPDCRIRPPQFTGAT